MTTITTTADDNTSTNLIQTNNSDDSRAEISTPAQLEQNNHHQQQAFNTNSKNDENENENSNPSNDRTTATTTSSSSSSPTIAKPHHIVAPSPSISKASITSSTRLVVVRYFLDRPGFTLENSAARLWFHAPSICDPIAIKQFLVEQGISLDGILIELYLDRFGSYMLLESCIVAGVEWDFTYATITEPGVLNIRLTAHIPLEEESMNGSKHRTDASSKGTETTTVAKTSSMQYANTTPIGLFSYSMMVGLEATTLFISLVPNSVQVSFHLTWGPYMFFVGGLLQLIVAYFQVLRNNIFGAVAFFIFGSLWFSNGARTILITHFSSTDGLADDYINGETDDWGRFVSLLYVLSCVLVLFRQTFVISKLTTIHIGLAVIKLFFQLFTPWSTVCAWMQLVAGYATSWFAFYLFVVEFTNQIFHREVYKTYKWSIEDSPDEVFGAAGRTNTLTSQATRLRQAKQPSIGTLRSAHCPEVKRHSVIANKTRTSTSTSS